MTQRIIKTFAAGLSLAQIIFVVSFLANNTSDNMPLFVFLFFVPAVNIFALMFNK